ncbi:MAG TPA: thiamine ABC transporter substrate-binding protein [Iamia sp.]|nr:thiamine ABC transporter substrate-binding protein [Iamia sp.]
MVHHTVVPSRRVRRALAAGLAATLLLGVTACTDDPEPAGVGESGTSAPDGDACRPEELPEPIDPAAVADADLDGTTVTLATHDSFAVSDGLFEDFTAETGIEVELVSAGDAGAMVSQAILTAGDPVADVMFGIDTTFLCRGTAAGLFVPYAPEALADVPDEYEIATDHLATPIDVGDVCLNYSVEAYPDPADAPQGLDDLTDPAFADAFVTENPETSSPGLAFLLATIAEYGADGWEDYWADLRENGVEVTSGWTEAFEDSFGSGAGSAERSIVTSYASSPVVDVLYSDPPRDEAIIGVVPDACFRQVELAGVLRGTDEPEAAARLVDFLLSPPFQEDIPLNMFVDPVNETADLPEEYTAHSVTIDEPLTLTPAEIEEGRDAWTERWTEIVLR